MAPSLLFFPASDQVAISVKSISELLGENLQVLTYTVTFNVNSEKGFALGFSKVSPMETFDFEDTENLVTFLEFDNDESEKLKPSYKRGTIMYVNIWRKKQDVNYIYIAIKIGDYRSGTYAFSCKPHHDFLAICCKPEYLIGGFINFQTTEEYLKNATKKDTHQCVSCMDEKAAVYYEMCGHVCYCVECADKANQNLDVCPICKGNLSNSKVELQSLYCVNCAHKRCNKLNALHLPCGCLVSCMQSVRLGEECGYCRSPVKSVKEVFLP